VQRPDAPGVETARLRLRPLAAADADRLAELDADPEVRRYVHLGAPPTRAELEAALPCMLARFGEPPVEPAFWAAEERSTGAFVGWFHLRPAAEPGVLELGYRLRRDRWGRGYGSEGARALVERAFRHLGADRVEAVALAENAASIRVMEKAGLRLREQFLYAGERPAVRYAVERGEHEGADGAPPPHLRSLPTHTTIVHPPVETTPVLLPPAETPALSVRGHWTIGVRVPGESTGGALAVLEHALEPGYVALPLHRRRRETTLIQVLEGKLTVPGDGRTVSAPAGSCVAVPPGAAFTFLNPGPERVRFTETVAPAGLELYYQEVVTLIPGGGRPDMEAIHSLSARYGLEFDLASLLDLVERYRVHLT